MTYWAMMEPMISRTLISSSTVIAWSLKILSTLRTPIAAPLNEIGTQRKEIPLFPILAPVLFRNRGSSPTFGITSGVPFSITRPTIP